MALLRFSANPMNLTSGEGGSSRARALRSELWQLSRAADPVNRRAGKSAEEPQRAAGL
jgi:hypothetical protein